MTTNKFLLFFILLVFGLSIYLIHSRVSFAAISSVTTGTPSIGKTSATLRATIDVAGATEAYDQRGFNLGTVSALAGNYNMGSSTEAGAFTGDGTFTHATTTDLSKGTAYYFRAYAASSTAAQTVYGSEAIFLTGIDDPASLAKTGGTDGAISLSWTKGTGADNTYTMYKTGSYPASITDGTQGCVNSGASCTVSNLNCGTTYYFRAWSSTTADGTDLSTTSDSYAQLTDSTSDCITPSGGTGGRSLSAPTTYSDSLVINQGAATTQSREVTLNLKAGNVSFMSISNDDLFLGSLEAYATTKTWTLTEGDGVKTVYVKFVSPDGVNSGVVSNTIALETFVPVVPLPVAEKEAPVVEEASSAEKAVEEASPSVQEKPISEMTTDEIKVKIAEILAQIESLRGQLTTGVSCAITSFDRNLKQGMSGDDVKCLQIILNSSADTKITLIGEGSVGKETTYFGSLTKAAAIKFQEKYASEILIPSGLNKGTGFIFSATRAKLNKLLKR